MKFENLRGSESIRATEHHFNTVYDWINNELEAADRQPLENAQIANLGIAVGFKLGKRTDPGDDRIAFKIGSIDQDDKLKILIETRHSDADRDGLKGYLQRYLNGGIAHIAEQIKESGSFDYQEFL